MISPFIKADTECMKYTMVDPSEEIKERDD